MNCPECNSHMFEGTTETARGVEFTAWCSNGDKEKCFSSECENFSKWLPNYELLEKEIESLKSKLSRYQRHPFDPEKRETWPELGKQVIGGHSLEGLGRKIVQLEEGEVSPGMFRWIEYLSDGHRTIWDIGRFQWWSYLPGGEEER